MMNKKNKLFVVFCNTVLRKQQVIVNDNNNNMV